MAIEAKLDAVKPKPIRLSPRMICCRDKPSSSNSLEQLAPLPISYSPLSLIHL